MIQNALIADPRMANAAPVRRKRHIHVNDQHPDFAWTMEILASIPRYPAYVDARLLAKDLGLSRHAMNVHIDALQHCFRSIRRTADARLTLTGDAGRVMRKAERYMTLVYGDGHA